MRSNSSIVAKVKRLLGESLLAVLSLCMSHSIAAANISEHAFHERSDSSDYAYIWITSDNENEPIKKLELHPVPLSEFALSIPTDEESPAGEEKAKATALSSDETKLDKPTKDSEILPPEPGGNVSGFETQTHPLFGDKLNPSPAILLINEQLSEDKAYYGFLSVTVRW